MLHKKLPHGAKKVLFALQSVALFLLMSCENEIKYVFKDSLSLKSMPLKTVYFVGERLNYDGLSVVATNEDGDSYEITEYEIAPEAGKQKITVKYKTRELTFFVNVNEAENSALFIKQIPKSAYYVGEKLDLSALELEIYKSDGTKQKANEFTANPQNGTILEKTESGKQTVLATCGDFSISFDISVYDVALNNLYIKKLPQKMNYYVGETLDLSETVIEAAFTDGSVKKITDYTTLPGMSDILTKVGKQPITISYLDKQISFDVTVQNCPLAFTKQPQASCFALYSAGQTLCADVIVDNNGTVLFEWYRKNPNETEWTKIYTSSPEEVEFGKIYTSTVTLPQNHYVKSKYYCKATFSKNDTTKSAESDVAEVEQNVNTGLPTIIIDTDGGVELAEKTDKINSTAIIFDAEKNELFKDTKTTFSGRGNSSWTMPKKSYSLKFKKKDADIFGMKTCKKLVLIANYADKTLLRNDYASYLANKIFTKMQWNPHFKSVNLIKNNEYMGTYLLGEQIKITESRVNIQSAADSITGKTKYKDYNNDGKIDINDGGFIVEINARLDENFNFKTEKGIPVSLKDPDTDDFVDGATTPEENVADYIKTIIQKAEDAIYSDDENEYSKYIDVDSFIDWYFVNEIAKNCDASWFSSVYMYYNPENQKLYMGPIWDFDIGFGNIDYNGCDKQEGFWIKQSGWYNKLFEYPEFAEKVQSRWNEVSDTLQSDISVIQNKADEIAHSADLNFKRWNILGIYVWPNAPGYEERKTYQSEVDYMTTWLTKRYKWFCTEINNMQ